ncbi:uncharacterized protein [Salminus brasiliensis]|uniref:uncharacterized protein n=1 Tax=Salminus brasiliensis TaxID=930266 RepID=UPI003B832C8B
MPDCCAAADCKQSTNQPNIAFFRFPLDPERCRQWVGNCGRPDLQAKTPEYLHRHFKLCSKHFEASLIHKESQLKCALTDGAVPTIFHFKTNKDNTQTSGRKRARQPAAEDPVKAKKTKDDPQATVAQPSVKEESGENSVPPNPLPDEPEKEDPATSKAKETLKVYFKETLAFTGFSIGNNATLGATTSMGSGPVGQLNPICAEKIEPKEVLKLGEDVMREEIRNSLRLARFFSILLQDETNIEGKDQIPVFVRTVTNDGFPQKHLMGFLPCDVDSDSLFLMLVSEIRSKWGLRMEHCRGFTYLTTGALCQKLKALSCRMLRDFPQVVLAPSDPYAFNMWLIRSMPVLSIQDVVETVEEVAAVLRRSSTLMKKLHTKITAAYSHIKGEVDRVKEACQNNWEYGTDAFQTMLDILEPLLSSIGEMCTSALSEVDTAIVEQLLKLKEKLKNFNFIISLVVLKNTLCCVSILNPSLRGIISISSTLQYTISNALKLLNKHLQEIPIFHRKWFSDAVGRAKKLGVTVTLPVDSAANGDAEGKPQPSPEDYYRETLSKMILQYLIDEVKRVLGVEMVRILRWLSLVPSYMADHNFSIRKDKVADANLNNLARPDSFYDELGCWEVKWRHASKRRILPTSVFATLKIPDIGFYPNVQSLLRVLGSIPCINADADVYGQYDMVLDRYHSYMKEVPAEQRLCNMAFVYVNQDVHVSIEDMVQSYVESHPDMLQLLCKEDMMEVQPSAPENNANDASKEDLEEPREMTLNMELERPKPADCAGTDKEALKSALQAAITAACNSQSRQSQGGQEAEVEYVTKSEMNEVLKVCEDVVRERILSEVGNSFFSLFIDRAVRFGEAEFLPLFLRFVDSFDVMRLELMGFVDVSLDTESMCERLFDIVTKEWGLDLKYCRGQAYLGSGEVSYKLKAFACKVQETHPLAICTHCSCYSFNTWWSRSVPVASVSRAIDALEKVVLFFSSMPELEKELDQVLAVGLRESYEKVHELQGTFCASWLEKHDSYDVFAQILEPLAQCLESFQSDSPQSWSLSVINQAKKLLHLIRDFDFIVAIVALKNVSSFTRELSVALQKDHFSAASQLCQISGIVATLNRVKTNIKVFHQNWFDEACAFAQSLGVQVKVPESLTVTRDGLLKPGGYYKDAVSLPLVDHLINSVKDHFSDDHKEALNFLSLVPCSVTMSYTFESLKSKPPLYVGDLPDPNNFFTELSCWKVKWKTKVVSPTIPDTIFQTLRLPLMQYFGNINTLLKIMCVLPSTALEYCGEVKRHKMFQDYLKSTYAKDRSPCLAMLQVGANFNRDLDRMVAQCLKVTPKTLEGICLDKESKTLLRNSEGKEEVENHKNEAEEMEIVEIFSKDKAFVEIFPQSKEVFAEVNNHKDAEAMDIQQQQPVSEVLVEDQQMKPLDENGHSADNLQSSERVFRVAARMARRNCLISELPKEEQDCIAQELGACHWDQGNIKFLSDGEILEYIVKSIRDAIVSEVQESPFFSIITDKLVSVEDQKYVPVFVRYVDDCTPKVELLGFLPFGSSEADVEAKTLSDVLTEEWGLQMGYCRGQSFMCMGASSLSLRQMSLDFLASYPLAVNTPSESCGLAYWLAVSLHNDPITKVLGVVEDLLLFFDQSPRLHIELSQTMEGLLNTPREALAEVPETCWSRWKKMEDFFDILVDMLEGVLSCLDSVSNNASGTWSNSMSIHALILSTAIRESDFVIPLVILKNACSPLRNCSTVFRCGNPADIICELEKIPLIVETLSKMLENVGAVHTTWFEEAAQLAAKVSGGFSYPDAVVGYESPEVGYREMVSIPVLSGLIEEMRFNFDECHLKALKVLSLLPTCNPLPILPEATDKLYTIYQSDLPDPDTAEEDINTWAAAWREKYQDASPPASISEALHHPEAKSHPNVTALLKLVAVLPSISMEWDVMKTTLNSMRTFLRNDLICRASKTNTVMLLMHRQTLQTLEEVIDKCMENDPESRGFLSQMKQNVCNMRMDGEVVGALSEEIAIATNGSGGSEEEPGTAPVAQGDIRELSPPAPNDTTETSDDGTMETNASSILMRIQESPLDCIDAQPTSVVPDGTEIPTTASEDQSASQSIITESVTIKEVLTMDLTTVVQGVPAEALTQIPAQGDATGAPAVVAAQEPIELIKDTAQNVTTESAAELTAQDVPTGAEVITLELVTAPEGNITEPVTNLSTQGVPVESVPSAPIVTAEPVAAAAVVMLELAGITAEAAVQDVHIERDAAAENVTMEFTEVAHGAPFGAELAAHGGTTELDPVAEDAALKLSAVQSLTPVPVTEAVAQSVAVDPVKTAQGETTETGTAHTVAEAAVQHATMEPDAAAQCIVPDSLAETAVQHATMEPDAAAQCIVPDSLAEAAVQHATMEPDAAAAQTIPPESVMEAAVQNETAEPHAAAEDVPMELAEVEQGTAPVLEPTVLSVRTGPEKADEDVPMELAHEAEGASTEPATELAAQLVTAEPVATAQDVPMELPVAQVTATEPVTEPSTQTVPAEPVASTEDAVLNLSELPCVNTAATSLASNIPEELVKTEQPPTEPPTEPGPAAQKITTESIMEEAVQHVTTEPNAAAEDLPMEVRELQQGTAAVPVTELPVQGVPTEPEKAAEDVPMKLADEAKGASTEPVQHVLTEPVTTAQDAAMELSAATAALVTAAEPVTEPSAQTVPSELVTSTEGVVQDLSETTRVGTVATSATSSFIKEPEKPGLGDVPEPITAAQEMPLELAQAETQEQVDLQDVSMEPDMSKSQCVTTECVAAAAPPPPDVAMELAESQAVSMEPVTLPQGACTMTTAVVQEVVSETVSVPTSSALEAHSVSTEPQADVQDVFTDPVAAVPDVSTKPVEEPRTDVQNSITEPTVVDLANSTEPAAAACSVTESVAAVPDIPTEPVQEPRTDVQNVTTEPTVADLASSTGPAEAACGVAEPIAAVPDIPTEPVEEPKADVQNIAAEPIVSAPTEPVMASPGVTSESTAAHQDAIVESTVPAQCVTLKPVLENQTVSIKPITSAPDITTEPATTVQGPVQSIKPITSAPDITTEPATAVQGVTIEPPAAVQDINMESVPSEHPNNMEPVSEVAEDVAMETAEEAQSVSIEPVVVAPDVQMDPAAVSKDVSMEPEATVEDVVMEPETETQEVSIEPIAVPETNLAKPDTDAQDVPMETVTEEPDVSVHATVDQGASVEPTAAAQDATLRNESQDVSSQVGSAAENDPSRPNVHATDNLDEANPARQDDLDRVSMVVGQASAPSPSSSDNASGVQGRIDPSCEESQDDTGHPKVVTEAAGQDSIDQPMEVADHDPVPHRVLFLHDGPVQEALIKEYANSKFFSILFEQQVEIEGHPYIPVGIRYMAEQTLCEDVLAFVLLGEDVGVFVDALTAALTEKCGLNLAFCRGQSILTVGVAAAQMRAVASLLSQRYPQARRTLCSSVSLNMWLTRSSTITEIADGSMWVEKLLQWLTEDAEKRAKLQGIVRSLLERDESKSRELGENLTGGQWERSHDILELTVEILEAVVLLLSEIKDSDGDQAGRTQALRFLTILQNFEFILTVVIMKNVSSLTKTMSQRLQAGSLDFCQAVNSLPDLLCTLKEMAVNIDGHLQTWLQEAKVLASKLEISVDHASQEPMIAHYRDVVSKGAVQHSIDEITELFSDGGLSAPRCMQVVPYVISRMDGGCVDAEVFMVYQDDLPDWGALQVELQRWREKWLESMAAQQPLPTCVLDTLKASDLQSFPNIETILRLLAVLPCCGGEVSVRRGKKSLREFVLQPQTSLPVLYPL